MKLLHIFVSIVFLINISMAKDLILTKKVDFDIGTKSVTLHGGIQKFEKTNYQFYANKGDTIHVSLNASKAHFNIYSPYKENSNSPIFSGKIEGKKYTGVLSKSGIYTVQVYSLNDASIKENRILYTLHINMD